MKAEYCLLYTTWPDENSARTASETLLTEKLVACTNLYPAVEAQYWWEGKIETSKECVMILKTTALLRPKLEKRFQELHPYEVPCFLEIRVDSGNPAYLQWLSKNLN
jgi:periplasmic divalent cation tolerance protein